MEESKAEGKNRALFWDFKRKMGRARRKRQHLNGYLILVIKSHRIKYKREKREYEWLEYPKEKTESEIKKAF